MSQLGARNPTAKEYKETGMTKQSFKDSTDINKILRKAQVTGTISHVQKHGAHYGDYAEFDFLQAQIALARGREIFDELPSEVRREFNQSPAEFFAFVNDPANVDRLPEVLPEIAEPGRYYPQVQNVPSSGQPREPLGSGSEPVASETPNPSPSVAGEGSAPSMGSEEP